MENHNNSQQNVEGDVNKFVGAQRISGFHSYRHKLEVCRNYASRIKEAPRMNSWPYPHPEKFPQFRNMFQDGTPPPVSTSDVLSQHLQQQQMQQTQIPLQLQQALQTAQTQSVSTSANSMPVMGTLQTVLTTGINPNSLNNGTSIPLSVAQALSSGSVMPTVQTISTAGVHTVPALTTTPSLHIPQTIPTTVNNIKIPEPTQMITRTRLQDLVREVDPNEQLDEEVEDVLLQMADDFVETALTAACLLAKHRKSNTVEVKDLQLHLERNLNMWIPGFGTDELRPYKRSSMTDAHKQRLSLLKRAQKKY